MNKVNPEINTDTEAQDTAAQETEAYYATNHAQVADTENFTSHTNEGFDDIPQSPPGTVTVLLFCLYILLNNVIVRIWQDYS